MSKYKETLDKFEHAQSLRHALGNPIPLLPDEYEKAVHDALRVMDILERGEVSDDMHSSLRRITTSYLSFMVTTEASDIIASAVFQELLRSVEDE